MHHEFAPSVFYREFSASNKPVLSVDPGDSIHTTTVDAGGTDQDGHKRVLGGNPQTGPFYIQSAIPGDTLVVHLTRLRLNRDYAISDDALVGRGTDNRLAVKMKDGGKTVLWHLDIAQGLASLQKPGCSHGGLHGCGAPDAGLYCNGAGAIAWRAAYGRLRQLWRQHGFQ